MPWDATGLGLEPLCFLGLFVPGMAAMMKSIVIHTVNDFHPSWSPFKIWIRFISPVCDTFILQAF